MSESHMRVAYATPTDGLGRTNEESLSPTMDISPSVTRTRAYEITDSEFQRMSWHQRQRFLTTLRAELGRLQDDTRKAAEMNRRRQERREWWRIELTASVERIREEAAQILAGLPPDPDAAKHRDALRTRYDRKANHE